MTSPYRRHFHPDHIRQGAMEEFIQTWHDYTSPSAAAAAIGARWGVGRTTLFEWLQADGQWPHTRVAENLRLAAENKQLRQKILELTGSEEP